VSPIVVGLALVLIYNGRTGWFGPTLEDAGIQVLFANPAIIMATVFVSLPLVVRELVPVLEEIGMDQEQAASSLGASAVQKFRRVTLPSIRWAVVYGVVLSLARSLGEFGAVKIVSGKCGRQDADRHAGGRAAVPELPAEGRVRCLLPARGSVDPLPRRRVAPAPESREVNV